jgi:ribosomal protein S18 acetylase RimI-like enzyme
MKKSKIQFLLDRIKKIYKEKGFRIFLNYLFNFLVEQFIVIAFTYKIELDKTDFIPLTKGLTFKMMKINDIDLIHSKYREESDEKAFQKFLEKFKDPENNGFIIEKNNEICGYSFIKYNTTYPVLKEKYIDINLNGYLSYDYVFTKYRGQKIQQFSIYNRLQILKEKNFKTATVLIEKNNYSSVKSYENFGFQKCVRLHFFRINGLKSKKVFKIISK